MKRIWITGSSGSGKTTLANSLGKKLKITVYHNDRIYWKENWQVRSVNERNKIIENISKEDRWIYEGNLFTSSKVDGRFDRCDTIIYLNINRFICLFRFIRRYLRHRGIVRPDLSDGCTEDIDWTIIKYILIDYPKKKPTRYNLFREGKGEGKKLIILNGAKDVSEWCNGMNLLDIQGDDNE